MSDRNSVRLLEDAFDAVVCLTWSNWATEPRSNRYHYATRFARKLPTYFVQPDQAGDSVVEEDSGVPNLSIVHCSYVYDAAQIESLKAFLLGKGVKRPLLWVYNINFGEFLDAAPGWFKIYHATEDYTITGDLLRFHTDEQRDQAFEIIRRCDMLVTVSESVRENYVRHVPYRKPSLTLSNGCDFEFWRDSQANDFRPGPDGDKVAFYQGGINVRLDLNLMEDLARRMPDWVFSYCGAADARDSTAEEMAPWRRMLTLPNVRYHGVVGPERIAELSREATVGIIPFKNIPLIHISMPLKAYEYVACGLPVVSVPIIALENDPERFTIATTPETFETAIRAAAPSRGDPAAIAGRMDSAHAMGYDARFSDLEARVVEVLNTGYEAEKKLNILMLYDDAFSHVKTIQEHLKAFSTHSRHNYFYLPTSENPAWNMFGPYADNWPAAWDFSLYDAIVWHYGMPASLPDYMSLVVGEQLARYDGLKVLFIQDEYEHTNVISDWINKAGIQLVMTCVPPVGRDYVYPPEKHPGVEFIQTLTGFVPEDEGLDAFITPMAERQVRVGYRGRILPYHYGTLGYEKYRIGVAMLDAAQARGVPVDIEVDDWKRIYGDDWYRFLGSVRATLGTESGSNVFDFDGTLKPRALVAREAEVPFERFFEENLKHLEGHVEMNQISPKIFEAIRLRTALVCFEGEYSGVIEADRHYIPLKKDFSNIGDVLAKLEDLPFLAELTERAHAEIIDTGRFNYRSFVQRFDDIVETRVFNSARAEIFSAPIAYRRRGSETFQVIARPTPFEYNLNTGVQRRPFQRRDVEAAMGEVRALERGPASIDPASSSQE